MAGLLLACISAAGAFAEAPASPAAPLGKGPVIEQVELRDLPLSAALRLLTSETGLNRLCSTDAGKTQVPVLGEIPLAGIFFKRHNTHRSRQELLILIRPHVLNTPSESESIGRKMLQDLSIHPAAPDARGTLNTCDPREVPTANPPKSRKDVLFRFHSVNTDGF